MNLQQIRTITAVAANKQDLYVTLAYVQDALDVASKLKEKLAHMPMAVRAMLQDREQDLEVGSSAEFLFLQAITYIEQLIDCL
jgi:hypothetical protein